VSAAAREGVCGDELCVSSPASSAEAELRLNCSLQVSRVGFSWVSRRVFIIIAFFGHAPFFIFFCCFCCDGGEEAVDGVMGEVFVVAALVDEVSDSRRFFYPLQVKVFRGHKKRALPLQTNQSLS
jgi:hypothetical protein